MAIDHSGCDHPRTPAGRRACRAAQGKPDGATPAPRGDHTGRRGKVRQRGAEPRWEAVPRKAWVTIPAGTRVRVEHNEPWAYPVGELVEPIKPTGWASVDLGDVQTRSRGPVWLGVRHVPYASITKIFRS